MGFGNHARAQTSSPRAEWQYSAGIPLLRLFEGPAAGGNIILGPAATYRPLNNGSSRYHVFAGASVDIRYGGTFFLSAGEGQADLTLGTGGACLGSGLIFGWLRVRSPLFSSLPSSAAKILKDFGLATLIAAVGLSAGPNAIKLVLEYGRILPVARILVREVPAAISLFIGHGWLKVDTPILLNAVAGQHCSTPAITALITAAGSGTPVIGYTIGTRFPCPAFAAGPHSR
jgi:AspT/YidE/YbjL antiporter-like protein